MRRSSIYGISMVAMLAATATGRAAAQVTPAATSTNDEAACARLRGWSEGKARVTRTTFVTGLALSSIDAKLYGPEPANSTSRRFCRVEYTIVPAPGADIRAEVWIPIAGEWNGRLLGTGNGGAAGRIMYPPLIQGLERGYAVANTDVGTQSGGNYYADPGGFRFGVGKPDLRANYVYRGIHAMTTVSKQLVQRYYSRAIEAAYFMGCSSGGQEALAEVQRFPADYDGVIIGNPALHQDRNALWQGWSYAVSRSRPGGQLTLDSLPVIAAEAMRQCDGVDGLKDGLIADPRACRVDYARLQCKPGQTAACLTPEQVATVRILYQPFRNSRTGEIIYPAYRHGAELGQGARVRLVGETVGSMNNPDKPGPLAWVMSPEWKADDWLNFDFDEGSRVLREQFAPYGVDDPDLSAFKARGGKIIMYHGWADPNMSAQDLIDYYHNVNKRTAGGADDFVKLFLAPGMYHCRGGPGPNTFGQDKLPNRSDPEHDIVAALDRWMKEGHAPDRLIATKYEGDDTSKKILRTRPLCPYPTVARWTGKGSSDVAGNFVCAPPATDGRSAAGA